LFWFDIRVCQTKISPPLFAQLCLIPALLCLRTDLSGAIVCLFARPVLGSRSPATVCLFVGQIVWPHPVLAGRLFVCSLRRGLSRPSLFVCLFQGCSHPLLSILALMHSGRRIGLLLSFYSASMVLSTRNLPPRLCICLTNWPGEGIIRLPMSLN
jgi:hypothetical protein